MPKVDLPLYFLHGVHDYTCCLSLAHEYFERVQAPARLRPQPSAPVKVFYTFDHSAHSPLYEEPVRVQRILSEDVLNGTNRLADPA